MVPKIFQNFNSKTRIFRFEKFSSKNSDPRFLSILNSKYVGERANNTIFPVQNDFAHFLGVVTAVNQVVRFSNHVVNHGKYVLCISFDAEFEDKSIGIGDVIVRLRKN